MRADIHDGPEHNTLHAEAGYIDARPQLPDRRKPLATRGRTIHWVALGARALLSEAITARRAIGVGFGLAGLGVIFSPNTVSWSNRDALIGSGLVVLAACFW